MPRTPPDRFKNSGAGLKDLVEAFNAWSSMLTNRSIEVAFAIIAANWAVHGSTQTILSNGYAKWSIAVTLSFLGVNLVGSWWMSHLHFKRIEYAEQNHGRWEGEYQRTKSTLDPWPYTKAIENLGRSLRSLKMLAPTIASGLFVASLFK